MKERKLSFTDYIYIPLLIILVLATGFNIIDRRNIRNEVQMTRQMLDARATIQIINFTALSEGRKLTSSEKETIKGLWNQAEYNEVQVKPMADK